jgi:hypothetical protein
MDSSSQPIPDPRPEDAPGHGEPLAPQPRVETEPATWTQRSSPQPSTAPRPYEPPISALAPLFRNRLQKMYVSRVTFSIDINTRPTTRVLGGYYKSRRLVRVYSHDRKEGRRPLNELFDTFLHEVAHHLEYTEPQSFGARNCRRIPGRMHSRLFWIILGDLKQRWADLQARHWAELRAQHRP